MAKKNMQEINYARKIIVGLVEEIVKDTTITYQKIAIRDQKTRLGSCSSKRNLNFNWQIVKFPKEIMKYVVVHEVCHLIHFNHSSNFWKVVESFDPDYKKNHRWIKENAFKYLK